MATTRLYAADTKVPVGQSRSEIERTLTRYGADAFMFGQDPPRAVVQFRAHDRYVRFELRLPTGRHGGEEALWSQAKLDQEERRRWRALLLVIKSKLEAVETGIETFEEAFMPQIVLPDQRTVSSFMLPQIERAYETGEMPPMLPMLPPGDG